MLRFILLFFIIGSALAQTELPVGYTQFPGNARLVISSNSEYEFAYLNVAPGNYSELSFRLYLEDRYLERMQSLSFDDFKIYLAQGHSLSVRPIVERGGIRYRLYKSGPIDLNVSGTVPPHLVTVLPSAWNLTIQLDQPIYFGGGTLYLKIMTGDSNARFHPALIDCSLNPWPSTGTHQVAMKSNSADAENTCDNLSFFNYRSWLSVNEDDDILLYCHLPHPAIGSKEIGLFTLGVPSSPRPYSYIHGGFVMDCFLRVDPIISIPITKSVVQYKLGHYHPLLTGTTVASYCVAYDPMLDAVTKVSATTYSTFSKFDFSDNAPFGTNTFTDRGIVWAPHIMLR